MAIVPQRRIGKTRKRKRRTHFKLDLPGIMTCPNCGEAKLSHTVCKACGFYDGRQVLEIKVKEVEEAVEETPAKKTKKVKEAVEVVETKPAKKVKKVVEEEKAEVEKAVKKTVKKVVKTEKVVEEATEVKKPVKKTVKPVEKAEKVE